MVKRKIKLLMSELRMLQSHKIDSDILHSDYLLEFSNDISVVKSHLTNPEPLPPEPDAAQDDDLHLDPSHEINRWRKTEDGWEREGSSPSPEDLVVEEEPAPPAPAWAKKLYKRIAFASHPDRTLNDHRSKKLGKVFAQAAEAMGAQDYERLLGFAAELDIEFDDEGVDVIPMLEKNIETLKKELSQMHKTVEWLWCESLGAIDFRAELLLHYFGKLGQPVNKAQLVSIITEIEASSDDRKDIKD